MYVHYNYYPHTVCSGTVFLVLFGSLRRQLAYVFTNVRYMIVSLSVNNDNMHVLLIQ